MAPFLVVWRHRMEPESVGARLTGETMLPLGRCAAMTDLVHDSALWLNRAQVARDAAAELGELSAALAKVVRVYYFGDSCTEGIALHGQLRRLVQVLAAELRDDGAEAAQLSINCGMANALVEQRDADNAAAF